MYISIIYSSICVCLLNTLCIQMHILWSYNSMDSSPIYYDITDPPTAQLRICQPSTSRWWSRNVSTHLKKKSKGEPSPKQRWTNHFATRWLQHTNGEKMRYRKKNPEKKKKTAPQTATPKNPSSLSWEQFVSRNFPVALVTFHQALFGALHIEL